jgi:hypothetical protein
MPAVIDESECPRSLLGSRLFSSKEISLIKVERLFPIVRPVAPQNALQLSEERFEISIVISRQSLLVSSIVASMTSDE